MGIIVVIVMILVLVIIIFAITATESRGNKKDELRIRKNEERLEEREKLTQIYNSQKEELISKHGVPDKVIYFGELDLNKEIIAFGETNHVWVLGRCFRMGDILNCTFFDNPQIVKGAISYETKAKTGNIVKRAVVGGVLTGGIGAVIGGATAKTATTSIQAEDKIYHDYAIIINVNSLSEPIIKIHVGSDGAKVNETVALFNVIIKRGKN